jgi:prepilin-type N-terminal cleavage/methylation domain-containing protein
MEKEMLDKKYSRTAFTLAEILIALVIIGVVAALTLPMFLNGTQDKEFTAAREKAVYNIRETVKIISANSGDMRVL